MNSSIFIILIIIFVISLIAISFAIYGSKIRMGLSPSGMYNVASCLVVASIISGIISFGAIAMALCSDGTMNYSHQDVIVDILAILVTVLMGWNIISLIDIKKEASRISVVSNDVEIVVKGILELSIHSFLLRKEKEAVIDNCFTSLNLLQTCEDGDMKITVQKEVMEVLHYIYSKFYCTEKAKMYNKKQEYKYILQHIDSPYTDEIRKMIDEADPVPIRENISFAEELVANFNGNEGETGTINLTF